MASRADVTTTEEGDLNLSLGGIGNRSRVTWVCEGGTVKRRNGEEEER
jgi:hypothetical protein